MMDRATRAHRCGLIIDMLDNAISEADNGTDMRELLLATVAAVKTLVKLVSEQE